MPPAPPNRSWQHRIAWRLGRALVVTVVLLALLSMTSSAPTNLGLQGGRLAPCPDSPNCVSSQAERDGQVVLPFTLDRPVGAAKSVLKQVIAALPRTRLICEEENYLHFEFRSLIFRFVDDVEFHFDAAAKTIQVRSASRVGHSDLGVNRRRIETIRRLFSASLQGLRQPQP